MKIALSQDIAAPRAMVFTELSDYRAIESALRVKVPDLQRISGTGGLDVGDAWHGTVQFHGLTIAADLRLSELTPPEAFGIVAEAEGLLGEGRLCLTEAGPGHTRLSLDCDVHAKGLRGRVALQPLRLVKAKIEAKLQERLARFARRIGRRARDASAVAK